MTAMPQPSMAMTEAEYLDFEQKSDLRHEYINGEVFAMTGASENHTLISGNLVTALNIALRTRPCKVYPIDMRVKVIPSTLYTYPDVSVVCGDSHFSDNEFATLLNPNVIIEVLSPSTEAYDRGKKFQEYMKIPSMQEYVLVSQEEARIEHFMRGEDERWILTIVAGLVATLELPSVGCSLLLEDVYLKVEFAS